MSAIAAITTWSCRQRRHVPAVAGGRENMLAKVSPTGLPAAPIRNKKRQRQAGGKEIILADKSGTPIEVQAHQDASNAIMPQSFHHGSRA